MIKSFSHIVACTLLIVVMATSFMLNTAMVGAAPTMNSVLDDVGKGAGYKPLKDADFIDGAFPQLTGRFVGIFLGVLGVIFTVLFLYAGYLWFTAEGDAAALQKAKDIMTRAVIGLIIVTSAYVITYYITVTLTTRVNFFAQ